MGEKRVCVTGAAGFIASSLVQALLNKGYHVFGTLRSLDDENKTLHLKRLDGADKRLTLVKADILNYESLLAAMKGCSGVFHTASPVPTSTPSEPEVEVLDPAVKGTLNVLRACSDAQIKRVVFTSSAAAIFADPNKPAGAILDETFWSDVNYCRESKNWYWLAKTLAEKEAWAYAENHGLDMVVVVPAVALGPVLPPILNTSSLFALELLNGSSDTFSNIRKGIVDVRDVAQAHILAYETLTAQGRYFCANLAMKRSEIVETVQRLFPNYALTIKFTEELEPLLEAINTQKIQDLGLVYTPIEDTLRDTVKCFQEMGVLNP